MLKGQLRMVNAFKENNPQEISAIPVLVCVNDGWRPRPTLKYTIQSYKHDVFLETVTLREEPNILIDITEYIVNQVFGIICSLDPLCKLFRIS